MNIISKAVGSGLFTGYIPIASGTFGSLIGLVVYLIPGVEQIYILIPLIVVFFFWGISLGNQFEIAYGKDPSQCTIDEVVGMWITLIMVPKTITNLIIAFFVWRIFDIIKPSPARELEKLRGGLGIMIDDVVAGLYALVVVHILIYLINIFNI